MIQIHIRTISALDLVEAKLLPQQAVVSIHLHDPAGRSIELWSQESRSYPTLSDAESEGAKMFDRVPEAMSYPEAEAAALAWVRSNLLDVKNGLDRGLLYSRADCGACMLDTGEEGLALEFKPTG